MLVDGIKNGFLEQGGHFGSQVVVLSVGINVIGDIVAGFLHCFNKAVAVLVNVYSGVSVTVEHAQRRFGADLPGNPAAADGCGRAEEIGVTRDHAPGAKAAHADARDGDAVHVNALALGYVKNELHDGGGEVAPDLALGALGGQRHDTLTHVVLIATEIARNAVDVQAGAVVTALTRAVQEHDHRELLALALLGASHKIGQGEGGRFGLKMAKLLHNQSFLI